MKRLIFISRTGYYNWVREYLSKKYQLKTNPVMNYNQHTFACFILAALLFSCSKNDDPKPDNDADPKTILLTEKGKALIKADNTFGIKLFKNLNDLSSAEANIIISPLSISMALGMTYNGANGETEAIIFLGKIMEPKYEE
jgi:serine protease inhibitor